MKTPLSALVLALALGSQALASQAQATAPSPVVVELFTSQGCSSCPPANANFRAIADRPDVLALSFSVTYWDHLGWKDTFGQQAFTQRQYDYERGLGHANAFTPQVVVNGRADVVGNERLELERILQRVERPKGPAVSIDGNVFAIASATRPAQPATIWLVHYDPHVVNVPIARGENSGATLAHRNVVHGLTKIGTWNGEAANLILPAGPAGMNSAVLIQEPGGPILAALKV